MRLEFVLKGNFDQYITRNAKGQNFLSYSQDIKFELTFTKNTSRIFVLEGNYDPLYIVIDGLRFETKFWHRKWAEINIIDMGQRTRAKFKFPTKDTCFLELIKPKINFKIIKLWNTHIIVGGKKKVSSVDSVKLHNHTSGHHLCCLVNMYIFLCYERQLKVSLTEGYIKTAETKLNRHRVSGVTAICLCAAVFN